MHPLSFLTDSEAVTFFCCLPQSTNLHRHWHFYSLTFIGTALWTPLLFWQSFLGLPSARFWKKVFSSPSSLRLLHLFCLLSVIWFIAFDVVLCSFRFSLGDLPRLPPSLDILVPMGQFSFFFCFLSMLHSRACCLLFWMVCALGHTGQIYRRKEKTAKSQGKTLGDWERQLNFWSIKCSISFSFS